jgi:hypothetical protein
MGKGPRRETEGEVASEEWGIHERETRCSQEMTRVEDTSLGVKIRALCSSAIRGEARLGRAHGSFRAPTRNVSLDKYSCVRRGRG